MSGLPILTKREKCKTETNHANGYKYLPNAESKVFCAIPDSSETESTKRDFSSTK